MLGVDPAQRLCARDFGAVPGSLARAEIAATAKHGEQLVLAHASIDRILTTRQYLQFSKAF